MKNNLTHRQKEVLKFLENGEKIYCQYPLNVIDDHGFAMVSGNLTKPSIGFMGKSLTWDTVKVLINHLKVTKINPKNEDSYYTYVFKNNPWRPNKPKSELKKTTSIRVTDDVRAHLKKDFGGVQDFFETALIYLPRILILKQMDKK